MLSKKTVFVIGAGAGAEYSMPLGHGLKSKIADALRKIDTEKGTSPSVSAREICIHFQYADEFRYVKALDCGHIIANGLPFVSSIDNYLELFQENELLVEVAKSAISYILLKYESQSKVYGFLKQTSGLDNKCWLPLFAELVFERAPPSDPLAVFKNLNIISFNYDRCLISFLAAGLSSLYHLPFQQSVRFLEDEVFLYPYGSLGNLDEYENLHVPFGAKPSHEVMWKTIKNIKTFSESVDVDHQAEILRIVADAEVLVFLGFSFQEQNMRFFCSGEDRGKTQKLILGTAFDFSPTDIAATRRMLLQLQPSDITRGPQHHGIFLEPVECHSFIRNYKRTIATGHFPS